MHTPTTRTATAASAGLTPADLLGPRSDYYHLFDDVSGADLEAWAQAARFADDCLPVINDYWERAETPRPLVNRLAELGLFNDGIQCEEFTPFSPLAAGLVMMEVARCDGSMGSIIAVQAGLVMRAIALYGSPEQKATYLGPLARAEMLGSFGLTEPDHGSDAVSLETSARRDGQEWVLNGQKRWIGFGATGDVTIVWARVAEDSGAGGGAGGRGAIHGFLVPQDTPGYSAEVIQGKACLRAIDQSLITLQDCRVPDSARLPGVHSFKDVAAVLSATRSGVAWMALGHGIACYEAALAHAAERIQFGKPLAHFQLIQQRLADQLQKVTAMALHCRRLADLEAAGALTPEMAALAKVHNTRAAREIAADARDMLGGSGILLDNHVIRHMVDMETLHTYEGTDTIQSLIVGRAITGKGAFA
ncbi:acyl-CoA dehydrogenase [Corynebacterium sp. 13CS0277]|uniref:acyl-CoA dehydrogenase family protein n=1 Tax=Corynebacterium sp. 13CS0277 TaxID=2071994 RepID=UPI000D04330A|nr:acyl-CoA dehydrogenase family protein [Corynebacterium sp. 13CS0277]PRQ11643.1 acyl-CoA dehydrogenase [Corynebacterium sp. 13CS0277]